MIDFAKIEKYKENNRIEAKKALGGLPHSIWETYSAFANTLGGIILLGVEEHKDKSLHPVDLPDPERLIKEFWEIVNKGKKVSANILSDKDVTVEYIDGKHIVAIRIPRARRSDKPVYIDGSPISGSYRRSGEGDYRCTAEEVEAMIRDAEIKSRDMTVLENMEIDALSYDSIKSYRTRMSTCRPEHALEELGDIDFLSNLGALGKSSDGKMRPTAAGLLMFGYECEIVKVFPSYSLDYQEQFGEGSEHIVRIISSSGDWSGNIYDFYFRVYNNITRGINGEDSIRVHNALGEALANCLVNADYHGKQGIVIIKKKDIIALSNPGAFRIDVELAKSGGISDPRNSTLIKMFSLIDIGKGEGGGISNIFGVWKKQGWSAPLITESFEPDRITLSLPIGKSEDKKATAKNIAYKQAIIAYLTENISANDAEIAELLGLNSTKAAEILDEMVATGIVVLEESTESSVYKLKA